MMFEDVIVDVIAALICFASACHPVLVGKTTPRGEYQLTHYTTVDPGYGGDILAFDETPNEIFAIHRVLDLPGQQRIARLRSPYAEHRATITDGCVNVDPAVFDALVNCCHSSKLIIK